MTPYELMRELQRAAWELGVAEEGSFDGYTEEEANQIYQLWQDGGCKEPKEFILTLERGI